jgi:nicotinate-nucleotide adenylyltransferase
MKLGIFGGTFNPIHFGHLRAAEEVRCLIDLDKVIFMPSGNPPLKSSELVQASHRYAMTRLATQSNVNFLVSDIEMRQEVKSYTFATVEALRRMHPEDQLFFIMGLDAFLDLPDWREPQRLIASIDFIIVTRPGFELRQLYASPYVEGRALQCDAGVTCLNLRGGRKACVAAVSVFDVSSTTIRRLVMKGKSIKYLLPEAVEHYIFSHRLYCD